MHQAVMRTAPTGTTATGSVSAMLASGKSSGTMGERDGKLSAADPGRTRPISVPLTQAARPLAWAESWRDEAFIHLPDIPEDIKSSLPLAIDLVQRDLDPGDPEEVLAALAELATRRGFTLPDGPGLAMDVELLAALPADLFAHALTRIWQEFSYRRMPEVADFMAHIAVELAERRARLDRLRAFELKLKTARLRKRWDEEASERAASQADRRARERTEMQAAAERMDREKVERKCRAVSEFSSPENEKGGASLSAAPPLSGQAVDVSEPENQSERLWL